MYEDQALFAFVALCGNFHREVTHPLRYVLRVMPGSRHCWAASFSSGIGHTGLEVEAVVSGLQDVAAEWQAVAQSGGHLCVTKVCVTKDCGPFAEI